MVINKEERAIREIIRTIGKILIRTDNEIILILKIWILITVVDTHTYAEKERERESKGTRIKVVFIPQGPL